MSTTPEFFDLYILFFTLASYKRVGQVVLITVLFVPVYSRVGSVSKTLWFKPKEK